MCPRRRLRYRSVLPRTVQYSRDGVRLRHLWRRLPHRLGVFSRILLQHRRGRRQLALYSQARSSPETAANHRAAPAGESGSVCAWGDLSSKALGLCCNGVCSSGLTDTSCGACGNTCTPGVCAADFQVCLSADLHDPVDGGPCAWCFPDAGDVCIGGGFCVVTDCSARYSIVCALDGGAVGQCCWATEGSKPLCASIGNDPLNCGGCGLACAPGAACVDGNCAGLEPPCSGNLGRYCGPDGGTNAVCCPTGCFDLRSSPDNCGACGNACPVERPECVEGICAALSCNGLEDYFECIVDGGGTGQCCGQHCVSLTTDSQNCGACYHDCGTNPCVGTECQ